MKFFLSNLYKNNTYIYDILPKNEFFWVLAWIKEVWGKDISKINFSPKEKSEVSIRKTTEFLSKYNIKYEICKNPNMSFWSQENAILVYWKNIITINDFIERINNKPLVWAYLWYPHCCINSRWKLESFKTVFLKSKKYSYLLNDISTYESVPENLLARELNFEFTKNFKYFSGAFLTWNPCSYDCKESIKKLVILEEVIKRVDPSYYEFILKRAKKNILYFDKANWISFDENIENELCPLNIFEWVFSDSEKEKYFSKGKYLYLKDWILTLLWEEKNQIITFAQEKDFFYIQFT